MLPRFPAAAVLRRCVQAVIRSIPLLKKRFPAKLESFETGGA
jgi:hypothetical protein